MPIGRRLLRSLNRRTDPERLAVARIAIGVCSFAVAWESWRVLARVLTPTTLQLPSLVPLPRVPAEALLVLASTWFVAASALLLGFATRYAGALITVLAAYVLLLDQQTYSNHLYLFVLIVGLLTVADSGAALLLDSRRRARARVLAWPVLLLKVQVSLVYGFSAVAKLTPQFLTGDALAQTLKTEGWLIIPGDWRTSRVTSALAAIAILVELFVAIGLWIPRTRSLAVVCGLLLHATILTILDSSRLSLGIFAMELLALYPLFFGSLARSDGREPS